jgi:hypothetical protein
MDCKKYKLRKDQRIFFFISGSFLWTGILLSGLSQVHWLLFIPPTMYIGASITGYCTMMMITQKFFNHKTVKEAK